MQRLQAYTSEVLKNTKTTTVVIMDMRHCQRQKLITKNDIVRDGALDHAEH